MQFLQHGHVVMVFLLVIIWWWKVFGESVETIHTGTEQAFLATHLESWRSDSMLIVCERQQNLLASRKLDGDQFLIFTGLCSCDASLLGIPFKQVFFSKGVWCRSFLRLFVSGSCEAITGLGTESDHGMCKSGRLALLLILWPTLTKLMKNDSRSVLCPILLSVQWPAMARLTENGPWRVLLPFCVAVTVLCVQAEVPKDIDSQLPDITAADVDSLAQSVPELRQQLR